MHRDGWVSLMYRRDHCCSDVAKTAPVRLITRLNDQSEFTQIACLGGENGGGMVRVEGMDVGDTVMFGSARIR